MNGIRHSFDLAAFAAGMDKRIWVIALCFAVFLALTVIRLVREIPVYRSNAIVESTDVDLSDAMDDQIRSVIQKLTSPSVISQAKGSVGRPLGEVEASLKSIRMQSVEGARVLSLSVDTTDPNLSMELANAWAVVIEDSNPLGEDAGFRIVERAVRASAPTTLRKLESIRGAALIGLGVGVIIAAFLVLRERDSSARSAQSTG